MRTDLIALAVRLGWVAAIEKEEPALAAVMERLRHEGEGCLLIYDNAIDADALKPYLPPGGRATGAGDLERARLAWGGGPGRDQAVAEGHRRGLPEARTGRAAERAAALALSETLGGLP